MAGVKNLLAAFLLTACGSVKPHIYGSDYRRAEPHDEFLEIRRMLDEFCENGARVDYHGFSCYRPGFVVERQWSELAGSVRTERDSCVVLGDLTIGEGRECYIHTSTRQRADSLAYAIETHFPKEQRPSKRSRIDHVLTHRAAEKRAKEKMERAEEKIEQALSATCQTACRNLIDTCCLESTFNCEDKTYENCVETCTSEPWSYGKKVCWSVGCEMVCKDTNKLVGVRPSREDKYSKCPEGLKCTCLYGKTAPDVKFGVHFGCIDDRAFPGENDGKKCMSFCESK